jgi:DNA-binding transcriptional regulator YhcF (GntR family)
MKDLTKTAIVFSSLKKKIINGELHNGDNLSSVRTLAGEFNVSVFTIFKALDLLEKENLITRVKKSGVYIGIKTKNNPVSCKKTPAKTRAEEIADNIISEIIQGTVKVGEHLTLNKELAFKYATSKKSIRKAIEILKDRKYIYKDGFRFVIGQPIGPVIKPAKNRVYILTNLSRTGWNFVNDYDKAFLESFEIELQKHAVTSFEYLDLWNESDRINKVEETTTKGFLIDIPALCLNANSSKNFTAYFCKTVENISKKPLPIVVTRPNFLLRDVPDFTFRPKPNLFFIGHDDFEGGEKAGNYLASMGHKQIAYFNFGNAPWDFLRFQGVECALKRLFHNESNICYFQESSGAPPWSADLSTYTGTPVEEKRRFLEAYSGLFKGYQFRTSDPVEEIYPFLANRILKDIYKKNMEPVFEKALKIKEITAWVGTGSIVTVAAAEFLKERGIDIPNEISLLGFDDSSKILEYGITTFSFTESKVGYLSAHCILGDIPIKKNRKGYVEYKGQIMVRKSVKAN